MYRDVVNVEVKKYLMLNVSFEDGSQRIVYFKPSHLIGVFQSLTDQEFFKLVLLIAVLLFSPVNLI